ncbi:MAG: NPCBM/NEW2 domain-containing protein [Armatimonadia bacterium]
MKPALLHYLRVAMILLCAGCRTGPLGAQSSPRLVEVYLSDIGAASLPAEPSRYHENSSFYGRQMTINGKEYARGIGTHAPSKITYDLEGLGFTRFRGVVGVDQETAEEPGGSCEFVLIGDGNEIFNSGVVRKVDVGVTVDVDVRGITELQLVVTDADDGDTCDHADWADARLLRPATATPPLPPKGHQPPVSNPPSSPRLLTDTLRELKVLVVCIDPPVNSADGKRLHEVARWNDPRQLADQYIAALRGCSKGYLRYRIVDWVDCDYFLLQADGFRYPTAEAYLTALRGQAIHRPDVAGLRRFITDGVTYHFNNPRSIAQRVADGEIDEVFVFNPWGAGGFGEANMAGPAPFGINGSIRIVPETGRNIAVMEFNYERGVDCMLENFCHRTERSLSRAYGLFGRPAPQGTLDNWQRFSAYDKIMPGNAAVGNCHFAPNSASDYDWGNKRMVPSSCDDWLLNWPDLRGIRREVDCSEWGGGDMRLHHIWWLNHLPCARGTNPDGLENNWWKYVVDLDGYAAHPR